MWTVSVIMVGGRLGVGIPQLDQGDTDVEKIAQADPDLILVPNATEQTTVYQLREIAPVYIYTHSGKGRSDWTGRNDQIADAMNLNGKLDDVKKRLADRQAQIAAEHKETLATVRAALFTVGGSRNGGSSEGGFGIAGPDSMSGRVLGPAGLQWDDTTTGLTAGIDGQSLSLSDEKITSTFSDGGGAGPARAAAGGSSRPPGIGVDGVEPCRRDVRGGVPPPGARGLRRRGEYQRVGAPRSGHRLRPGTRRDRRLEWGLRGAV
jgi:hypothetical protein